MSKRQRPTLTVWLCVAASLSVFADSQIAFARVTVTLAEAYHYSQGNSYENANFVADLDPSCFVQYFYASRSDLVSETSPGQLAKLHECLWQTGNPCYADYCCDDDPSNDGPGWEFTCKVEQGTERTMSGSVMYSASWGQSLSISIAPNGVGIGSTHNFTQTIASEIGQSGSSFYSGGSEVSRDVEPCHRYFAYQYFSYHSGQSFYVGHSYTLTLAYQTIPQLQDPCPQHNQTFQRTIPGQPTDLVTDDWLPVIANPTEVEINEQCDRNEDCFCDE